MATPESKGEKLDAVSVSITEVSDTTVEVESQRPESGRNWWSLGTKLSQSIHDYTPMALIVSYYISSVTIYTVCSSTFIKIFWLVYILSNFYIAGMATIEAFLALGPIKESRKRIDKAMHNGWKFPTADEDLPMLDIVFVAYLPNEKDIIIDRILYLTEKIVYPKDRHRINIVYNNGPVPAVEPVESTMHAMVKDYPHLRVMKVENSKSKADNLNYFLSIDSDASVIAIYDCDHYPHPHGPIHAMERFMEQSNQPVDIVQGRCIIMNPERNLLTKIVAVEFDKIYGVSHPGRSAMWNFGLFCGSNGYWRADLLRKIKMDGSMLTEDIDSALRALAQGANAVHDSNVISYELAPTTWQAFWKQRLRWAQGWTQASIKHLKLTWEKPEDSLRSRSFRQRFGIFSLLLVREFSYYLVSQYLCLTVSFALTEFPKTGLSALRFFFFQYPVAWWMFFISIVCLIATLWITNIARSEFVTWKRMILFSVFYAPYLVLNATLGLYGHARHVSRYSAWNTTSRT